MVTGDHPATALPAVAQMIGVRGDRVLTGADREQPTWTFADVVSKLNVFAWVRPEQELQLVDALQARGEIVATTGDGLKDAPTLMWSYVGVAMWRRGSGVGREVADLILLDENFAMIVGFRWEFRSKVRGVLVEEMGQVLRSSKRPLRGPRRALRPARSEKKCLDVGASIAALA